MGFLLGPGAALPGRIVIVVAELLGIGQFQDEANAAVLHGEDDGGQVALGGVGEAVGAVSLEGFLDLIAGADRADGGVAGVGHGVHWRIAPNKMLPNGALHVMTLMRITAGISKAEDDRKMDTQIGFADAMQRVFPTTVASYPISWLDPSRDLV